MKNKIIIFGLFALASFLTTACNRCEWGGDDVFVISAIKNSDSFRKNFGRYEYRVAAIHGYGKDRPQFMDYIIFNSDSVYHIGDTLYLIKK